MVGEEQAELRGLSVVFVSRNNRGTMDGRHVNKYCSYRVIYPMNTIAEADERDGIRFTFNTWPGTRMEATKCVIPMACL